LGFVVGLATAAGFQHWFTVVFKRAEDGTHTLTADISPEALYAFSDGPSDLGPLRGLIKAGSQYTVEMRKGSLTYICFRTVVAAQSLKRVSGPLEPLALNTTTSSSSTASAVLCSSAEAPNPGMQRTRYARR